MNGGQGLNIAIKYSVIVCDGVQRFHWSETNLVLSYQVKNLYRVPHRFLLRW